MLKVIKNKILEIFFPAECIFCKRSGSFLCNDCKALLEVSSNHFPKRSAKYLDDIYSACDYQNRFVKRLIMHFKYEPFQKILALPLAEIIADHLQLAQEKINCDAIITAVPLSQKRIRWRGFNQAQVIALELAKTWQLSFENNLLIRSRETLVQATLDYVGRQENIKGAFTCIGNDKIKNKIIYLVDDIVTSGATMNECARILKKNGAAKVIGVTVAYAKD